MTKYVVEYDFREGEPWAVVGVFRTPDDARGWIAAWSKKYPEEVSSWVIREYDGKQVVVDSSPKGE